MTPTGTGTPGALVRPDWRASSELKAGDLRLEQKYDLQRLRLHRRMVHGWGVVCGLKVTAPNHCAGWGLLVCPGYGISPCGDEIVVLERFRFNLQDYLWTQPVGLQAVRAWIAIEATGESGANERAAADSGGCGCGNPDETPSRLADGFRIVISWIPPFLLPSLNDPCSGSTPNCPVCPETCGLMLASVALPASGEPILNSDINNTGGQ